MNTGIFQLLNSLLNPLKMEPENEELEQVYCHLPASQVIICETCKGTNVFIEKNQIAICRDCGEIFTFLWEWLVSFADLKQAIYNIAVGETHEDKIVFLNDAKSKRPFWNNEFRDGRLFAEYFNLFVYLKFGPVAALQNDRQAEIAELPTQREEAIISVPKAKTKLPAVSANGGRKNVSSGGNIIRSSKSGQEASVRSTPPRTDKSSLQPLGGIRNKRGPNNGVKA